MNRMNGALAIRERDEERNCWRRMEKFVGAIIERLHDDLEDHWKKMMTMTPAGVEVPAGEAVGEGAAAALPEEFKARIRDMNGGNLILVLEKNLFETDIRSVENRLSIPLNQIRKEFLTRDEKVKLSVGVEGMEVQLLQPSLELCKITLKRWRMKRTCFIYVLTKQWNSVVLVNSLKTGDLVQVWSFRVGSELRFALVRRN